jgi:prepilin-type N-terminal cleavage/methylation domain-containing protein/prepilin-type processing-associated H-X9-DG protein
MVRGSHQLVGFTLVELLVVVSIIGLLMGLLLPAVQSSRESARRSQCVNHLKQLGLAFQNHHSALGYFPTGGWDWNRPPTYVNGTPAVGSEQQAGWGFQILPYIEQEVVWQSGSETAVGTPITTFFCPSRRDPQTVVFEDKYQPPITGAEVRHALCDFAASNRNQTGAVKRYEPQRMSRVTDGASHTLVVADKRLNVAELGSPQDDDNEGYTSGWNEDTIRRTDRPPKPDHFGNDSGDGDGEKLFGSSHSAGVNAAMLDGSVRSISFEVEKDVFRRLGDIRDGEFTDHDQF